MEILNHDALSHCIRTAVRAELLEHFKTNGNAQQESDRLLSKQELAGELGVSLVTLTDWMKKGLPYLRLHKRVYFQKKRSARPHAAKSKVKWSSKGGEKDERRTCDQGRAKRV